MSRSAVFLVKLSRPSAQSVSVNYTTAPGTAVAGSDFTAVSGTITFAPGQTVSQVIVPIVEPLDGEPQEQFTLVLSNPVNATLANTTGTCTIPEKNPTQFPVVNVNNVSGRTITFTVSLSQAHTVSSTISYATQSISAIAGQDFTAATGTLTYAVGETTKSVTVPILARSDRNLTFKLALSNPNKLTLFRQRTGIGTITPDSNVVSLVAAARAANTANQAAIAALASALTAKNTAQTELDAATTAYNNAVDAQNVAIADLAANESNVAHCQQVLTNTQVNAMNFAGDPAAAALVSIASSNLTSATNARNAAQTRLNDANTAAATALSTKNTKTTAYQTASSTYATRQSEATSAQSTATSTRAAAEAAFVGSTTFQM